MLEDLRSANETDFVMTFFDSYMVINHSIIQMKRQSDAGCNETSVAAIVGIVVLCVVIILAGAIALILVKRSEPKSRQGRNS